MTPTATSDPTIARNRQQRAGILVAASLLASFATLLSWMEPGAPVVREPLLIPQHRIDLATASVQELALLSGIGPALAARIAAFRESRGGLLSLEQLQEVEGIGPKTAAALEEEVRTRVRERSAGEPARAFLGVDAPVAPLR